MFMQVKKKLNPCKNWGLMFVLSRKPIRNLLASVKQRALNLSNNDNNDDDVIVSSEEDADWRSRNDTTAFPWTHQWKS